MIAPVGFHRAESVEEACAILQESDDARIVSGGTALSILMRQRLVRPELLVGIKTIPRLREIEANGVLRLGAAVPVRVAEQHPAVLQRWPLVAETLRHVATPRRDPTSLDLVCWHRSGRLRRAHCLLETLDRRAVFRNVVTNSNVDYGGDFGLCETVIFGYRGQTPLAPPSTEFTRTPGTFFLIQVLL